MTIFRFTIYIYNYRRFERVNNIHMLKYAVKIMNIDIYLKFYRNLKKAILILWVSRESFAYAKHNRYDGL